MTTSLTVSTSWVQGITRLFERVGLDTRALFRDSGLSYQDLSDKEFRFEADRISTLWELAVERSGDPNLGLAMSDMAHSGILNLIVYSMMASPNLLAAVERFLRYTRIVSDVAEMVLVRHENAFTLTIRLASLSKPVPRARVDFVAVTLLNIMRWLTGVKLRPLAVDFPYPEPANLQPYQFAFGCPLHFNAQSHKIHFAEADLMLPLPTANSDLAVLNDRVASERLIRLDVSKFAPRVKQLIVRRLQDGDPSRAEIAEEMCLGERTLQRRLRDEGTSFNVLLDATRRELADQYLRSNSIALAEAAYLLGFKDQSTFFRACRRWFGASPGEYRSRVANTR